jgi:dual specificity tyrosine-phosphorylation-regulated kinase 1
MWSLGCIFVEMHTGEPLFSGTDQFDQMQKIVGILGLVPDDMLQQADDHHRLQFFEQRGGRWTIKQKPSESSSRPSTPVVPSDNPIVSLKDVVEKEANRKKKYSPSDAEHSARQYELFVDLIFRMLAFRPGERIRPADALEHPFIVEKSER